METNFKEAGHRTFADSVARIVRTDHGARRRTSQVVSLEKEGTRRITAMGSYWAAVMGKTVPFEEKRQVTQTKLPKRKERQTDSWVIRSVVVPGCFWWSLSVRSRGWILGTKTRRRRFRRRRRQPLEIVTLRHGSTDLRPWPDQRTDESPWL
ncbi:hypothetical protein F2Q69_00035009 [Brassica cretica]|uniref:Uncharacterized protein n=1 Tax=Brassica cretica TaxID=69181 RepID=A0A8S9SM76_BRACR|nr:hypothetical protein F2Q69_00035009 [Brassica cretica]